MKYPKLREIKGAVISLLSKPYTSGFPKNPHIPFPAFRGRPYYHEKECIGCTACVNVCPTGALSVKDVLRQDTWLRILKIRWDVCIACGMCEANCVTKNGIKLSQEFDLATCENRDELNQIIEKPLLQCESCNQTIACNDHLHWTIKKLGALYTSNTSLIAYHQSALQINSLIKKDTEGPAQRGDRFRVLCPRCRRETVFIS